MYEALKDFQVLAAGVFAVMAAGIGFIGVWYAQRKTLDNAERERKHREQMTRLATEKESDQRRDVAIIAFSSDLNNFLSQIQAADEYLKEQLLADGHKKSISGQFLYGHWETPIFDMYMREVTLLQYSVAKSVLECYAMVKAYRMMSLDKIIKFKDEEAMGREAKVLQLMAKAIKDTVMRLHAVRCGYPDPGKGKGEDFWMDRGDPEQF